MATTSGDNGVPPCYYPSLRRATEDYACNLATGASFCCARGYACLENNVCASTINNATHLWNRGSCTDLSWSSQSCPQFCRDFQSDRGTWIVQCESATDPETVCCYDARAEDPGSCCTNSSAIKFTIPGATTAFRTIDLAAATATRSLSSSVTTTETSSTSSTSTNVPVASTTLSSGGIAGIVVGAVAGAALVVTLVLYLCRRSTRSHSRLLQDDGRAQAAKKDVNESLGLPAEMDDKRVAEASNEQALIELDTGATTHELAGSETPPMFKGCTNAADQ